MSRIKGPQGGTNLPTKPGQSQIANQQLNQANQGSSQRMGTTPYPYPQDYRPQSAAVAQNQFNDYDKIYYNQSVIQNGEQQRGYQNSTHTPSTNSQYVNGEQNQRQNPYAQQQQKQIFQLQNSPSLQQNQINSSSQLSHSSKNELSQSATLGLKMEINTLKQENEKLKSALEHHKQQQEQRDREYIQKLQQIEAKVQNVNLDQQKELKKFEAQLNLIAGNTDLVKVLLSRMLGEQDNYPKQKIQYAKKPQ